MHSDHIVSAPTDVRSDLQVCAHGTAAGNIAIVGKQFDKLGVKTWLEVKHAMMHFN